MIMKNTFIVTLIALLSFSPITVAGSAAHAHVGHVSTSWADTPDQVGFLVTATKEAQIAQFHSGLAIKKLVDINWMKVHTLHVKHALDGEGAGPGLGYGVLNAAAGVVQHIELAAGSVDASDNVKLHAQHIAASANNTLKVAREMLNICAIINVSTQVDQIAAQLIELHRLAKVLSKGVDANGDGSISWVKGEGGLMHAQQHLGFLRSGENI